MPNHETYSHLVIEKRGLQFGGACDLFNTTIPLYPTLGGLDSLVRNDDYSTTEFEFIERGFRFGDKRTGDLLRVNNFNLSFIKSCSYDFITSSNIIEHAGPTFELILECRRILKVDGFVIFAFPCKSVMNMSSNLIDINPKFDSIDKPATLTEGCHPFCHSLKECSSVTHTSEFSYDYSSISRHSCYFDKKDISSFLGSFGFTVFKLDEFSGYFFTIAFK
jgi:SAM-dependent methyltransferase